MLSVNKYNFNTFQTATRHHGASKPAINNKLSIWYKNDLHGNTDKMAGIMESAKYFDTTRKDCTTFKLSAGDNVSGGDVSKNNLVMDLMQNAMGIDATAVGNHEIDATIDGLDEFGRGKNIDFIATNVKFDDEHALDHIVKRSMIKEKDGIKYGFVGAMPLDFKTSTKKAVQEGIEVMDFDDTIEALQEEINELKKQGVNRIILLSHSSYEIDKKYASSLDGIDIIIGGHSHTVVDGAVQGENVVRSKSGEPVVITQAGENGKYYGILDVEFDDMGKLIKISNQLIPLSSKKSPTIEYVKEQKMGISPTVGRIKEIEQMPKNRRTAPHAWANLVVDSMKMELNADVAFLNAANIRKVPAEGKLTERDITESAPMKNRLIKTQVTQKQMVEAIKQASLETLSGSTGEPGLLYASGLTYKIDSKGNLLEMSFVDKNGNKAPIDINNPSETITYTAIYDDFTMRADGEYPSLAPKFPVEYFEYDKDKTAIDYISKMPNKDDLVISNDNRLEIVQTSQMPQLNNNSQKFLDLTVPKAS